MQKLLFVYNYYSENRATSQIWKVFPNMVFPRFGGRKWRRSEHAHASYPELSFRPPGFSPYMAGREERRVHGLDYTLPHDLTVAKLHQYGADEKTLSLINPTSLIIVFRELGLE